MNNSTRGSGSLCRLVQGIPPLLSDSTHLHSSQPCPGADGMQHYQHAVQPRPYATGMFFVYSLKKAKNDIFSVSAHLPSLQMVTELPDSTKGGAKGLVAVWGGWAGLSQHPSRPFSPNYTLKIRVILFGIEGPPCGLGGKGVLCLVCKLFEIDPRRGPTNIAFRAEFDGGAPPLSGSKEADAESGESSWRIEIRKKLKALSGRLPDRSGVRTLLQRKLQEKGEAGEEAWEGHEGTHSSQGVSSSQTTYEGEVMIEEPVNAAPHSISSGPGRMSGLNHSGLPWSRLRVWLTWLRKLHLSTVRATLIRMLMQLKRPRWRKREQKAKVSLPTTRIAGYSPGERASLKKPRLTPIYSPDS
ncbi:hypothetical protein CK203_004373 [Vitis vinifera]|uniref:Uncharacterized protein n=1 Tax=Vitis vinifera TaxID=29760 RepID=A0A438K9E0_VITVI|nr:hypothetical protein CK203_004373 [Vitis vinifera]